MAPPLTLTLHLLAPFGWFFGAQWRPAGEMATVQAPHIGVTSSQRRWQWYTAQQAGLGAARRWSGRSPSPARHSGCIWRAGAGQAVSLAMLLYFGFYFWRLATWPVAETPR